MCVFIHARIHMYVHVYIMRVPVCVYVSCVGKILKCVHPLPNTCGHCPQLLLLLSHIQSSFIHNSAHSLHWSHEPHIWQRFSSWKSSCCFFSHLFHTSRPHKVKYSNKRFILQTSEVPHISLVATFMLFSFSTIISLMFSSNAFPIH